MLGLGYLGLGENEKAKQHLLTAARMDVNHQGVKTHLKMI